MKTSIPSKISLPIYADELQKTMLDRFSRIEGQVRGVAKMVEAQRPCMEQLASIQSAMKGLTKTVLRNYLERRATDAIRSGDDSVYDELMDAIYVRDRAAGPSQERGCMLAAGDRGLPPAPGRSG